MQKRPTLFHETYVLLVIKLMLCYGGMGWLSSRFHVLSWPITTLNNGVETRAILDRFAKWATSTFLGMIHSSDLIHGAYMPENWPTNRRRLDFMTLCFSASCAHGSTVVHSICNYTWSAGLMLSALRCNSIVRSLLQRPNSGDDGNTVVHPFCNYTWLPDGRVVYLTATTLSVRCCNGPTLEMTATL